MSEWLVHLVEVGELGNHPNADTLDITQVYGQSVICKRGLYKPGDLAVFFPPDTVMPGDKEHPLLKDNPQMKPGQRVDAVRLRGVFSNGFLVPAGVLFTPEELKDIPVGTHVAERIGVTKYEDARDRASTQGENEKDPGFMPVYTDIEAWPKFRNRGIIEPGDLVVLTEKIHGANGRFCYRDSRLWVGSRTCVKAQYEVEGVERNLWWKVAKDLNLEERFKTLLALGTVDGVSVKDTVVYGEVYGQVQDLRYGIEKGATLRVFDTWNPSLGHYNNWETTKKIVEAMGLELVPVLYEGPWKPELEELRNGPSVLYPGHTREGFVMKPLMERWNYRTQRTILKVVGEDYKLRKRK